MGHVEHPVVLCKRCNYGREGHSLHHCWLDNTSDTYLKAAIQQFVNVKIYECLFPVIGVTIFVRVVSLCVSGVSARGVCVFQRWVQTEVHHSHSVGVSDHFAAAAALRAQTQQEADVLLLASRCGWCFTAQHYNVFFCFYRPRAEEKICTRWLTNVLALKFSSFLLFRMFSTRCLHQSSSLSWAWWLWPRTLTQAHWSEGWGRFL